MQQLNHRHVKGSRISSPPFPLFSVLTMEFGVRRRRRPQLGLLGLLSRPAFFALLSISLL
jgi:hypothetical protein